MCKQMKLQPPCKKTMINFSSGVIYGDKDDSISMVPVTILHKKLILIGLFPQLT
jgi:hypothetical protein